MSASISRRQLSQAWIEKYFIHIKFWLWHVCFTLVEMTIHFFMNQLKGKTLAGQTSNHYQMISPPQQTSQMLSTNKLAIAGRS
jgi:hypothetical protein